MQYPAVHVSLSPSLCGICSLLLWADIWEFKKESAAAKVLFSFIIKHLIQHQPLNGLMCLSKWIKKAAPDIGTYPGRKPVHSALGKIIMVVETGGVQSLIVRVVINT